MIREFSAGELPASIDHALMSDASVVRGLIDEPHAAAINELVPRQGKKRVYLNPSLAMNNTLRIRGLVENRRSINRIITEQLGRLASFNGLYVMRPDMLRVGKTNPHLDGRGAVVSGSLNLDSAGESTRFFARRLVDPDAPYSTMEAIWERSNITPEEMPQCELNVGDMVVVARGAVHGSIASIERKSITYRVRGFVPGDIK